VRVRVVPLTAHLTLGQQGTVEECATRALPLSGRLSGWRQHGTNLTTALEGPFLVCHQLIIGHHFIIVHQLIIGHYLIIIGHYLIIIGHQFIIGHQLIIGHHLVVVVVVVVPRHNVVPLVLLASELHRGGYCC